MTGRERMNGLNISKVKYNDASAYTKIVIAFYVDFV